MPHYPTTPPSPPRIRTRSRQTITTSTTSSIITRGMDEPEPPRGRWRLVYHGPDKGFCFSVQPLREGRRCPWPPPRDAWLQFYAWQSARSRAVISRTGGFSLTRLMDHIQVTLPEQVGEGHLPTSDVRIVLRDFLDDANISPEDAIVSRIANAIDCKTRNPLLASSVLSESMRLQRLLMKQPHRDLLTSLPAEILDMIIRYSFVPYVDSRVYLDSPTDRGRKNLIPRRYTRAERALLDGIPKTLWPLIVALPTFGVSQMLRYRTATEVRRMLHGSRSAHGDFWTAADGQGALATVRLISAPDMSLGATEMQAAATVRDEDAFLRNEPLALALSAEEGGQQTLRQIPPSLAHLTTEMIVEAQWDCQMRRLLTPIQRLIGMESNFVSLKRVAIRCQLVNEDLLGLGPASGGSSNRHSAESPDSSPTAIDGGRAATYSEALAEQLYGADGAYMQIGRQIARALTTALWASLSRRSGLWPGYCLRPTCTTHEDGKPCRARLPFMAHRMPVVFLDIVPIASVPE